MDVDVYHNIGPNHWCTVPIKFKAKTDAYSSLLVILYFHSGSRLSLVGREHLYIITNLLPPTATFSFNTFNVLSDYKRPSTTKPNLALGLMQSIFNLVAECG